jgi:hypothetical protein
MPPEIKFAVLFTAITIATVTALSPVHAEPLPLDITYLNLGDDIGALKEIHINIPVNNTTQPAYGGVVRYYDVAIAQAVAITYRYCQNQQDKGADLHLTAGNQRQINMGKFYISCNLAYDLVTAYDLSTEVVRPVKGYGGVHLDYMPSLNLNTDAKSQRFVNFSSNFKPVER